MMNSYERSKLVDTLNSLKNRIDSFVISKGKAPLNLMKEYKSILKSLGDTVVWSEDKKAWEVKK